MSSAILTTPEAKRRINGAFRDISDVLIKIEAGRDTIKQIIADFSEEFQIDKKQFRKMAMTYHKGNFGEATKQNEEFEIMYETLTGERAGDPGDSNNGEDDE
jgi:hypothetical protein